MGSGKIQTYQHTSQQRQNWDGLVDFDFASRGFKGGPIVIMPQEFIQVDVK